MNYLYTSTDPREVHAILSPQLINTRLESFHYFEQKYKFHEIDAKHGQKMAQIVGFNPVCVMEINDSTRTRDIESIVRELVKNGQFVTLETDRQIIKYNVPYIREKETVRVDESGRYRIVRRQANTVTA